MGHSTFARMLLAAAGSLAALFTMASAGAVEIRDVPVLPPEIKIVDTPKGPVLATKDGMTLYKKLPRIAGWGHAASQAEVVGQCVFQCPEEFPRFRAQAGAKPVGDFTIVKDETGAPQWAYKGVALLTFTYDRQPGSTMGEDTYAFNGPRVPVGEAAWLESETRPLEPAAAPAPTTEIPPGVMVQTGIGGNRFFADAGGFTLYVYAGPDKSCAAACMSQRKPLKAGALARAMGNWTPVANGDGTKTWAFKGKPVFLYARDTRPGEAQGEGDDGWEALVEYASPLPAEIAIGMTKAGPVYVDKASGKTLYYQGFNHRPYQFLGFNHAPHLYGTVNCYNACATEYPPLLAPAGAKAMGEWWVLTRVDGQKQWAYRGIPVYTYASDQPGQILAAYKGHIWTEALANNPGALRLR